jgi:SAM-dependent methyltransferase
VRRGYDLVSRAYRSDNADDGPYGEWLDLLEARLEPKAEVLDLGCGCGLPVARRLVRRHHVTGVDLSPVQITRARELVPGAAFICDDMTAVRFDERRFDGIVCLYALIHVPRAKQPQAINAIAGWLRPDGMLLATVGERAWTGIERDWLGVAGADMWWDHADAATYRRWFADTGLGIELERFVPEGDGGHRLLFARREKRDLTR